MQLLPRFDQLILFLEPMYVGIPRTPIRVHRRHFRARTAHRDSPKDRS